jgi:hypothetical protein
MPLAWLFRQNTRCMDRKAAQPAFTTFASLEVLRRKTRLRITSVQSADLLVEELGREYA